jgi:hypothetical protein
MPISDTRALTEAHTARVMEPSASDFAQKPVPVPTPKPDATAVASIPTQSE